MRLPVLLLACSLFAGVLCAQEQERSLAQRLNYIPMKPGEGWANPLANKEFNKASVVPTESKVKAGSYSGEKDFDAGTYSNTRSFFGIKNPWFGRKVFKTGQENLTTKYELKATEKQFVTDKARVKSFAETDRKPMDASQGPAETRPFLVQGKSQKALDQQSNQKELTIDEVRKILNKDR
ncbi:hypothetical protein TSACC_21149 [Terrimicrobium sacchariphilum]|jgi:hypothetical protein|uniref:Uncharacterized protein n=1 Tax=Terrimicrobium sacchariphilum TaxID=690879 RepID=A0A146G7Q2_TERSA|nr:hypothetical protein [Terrimicrobium sacchariphilum]GAT32748.1 hypothetical protein TSACC_21149 [Terrimicrobium sacchariphilum]